MVKTPTWDAASLKAKREADRLSAEKLGKLLGTSKENIYKWESGTVPSSKAMRKKVQEYIDGVQTVGTYKPNGTVKKDDYKEKYYTLLEKYTALLETK